jgi:hypothetical protein
MTKNSYPSSIGSVGLNGECATRPKKTGFLNDKLSFAGDMIGTRTRFLIQVQDVSQLIY